MATRGRFTELWRQPDFLKLWAGQTVSQFGSQITLLALPLVAALTLEATPAQMGLLGAVEFAPFLILSLFAGVWVDRLPRRPILIAADLGRAVALLAIPVAAWTGALQMELLYAVALITGSLTVFFDVAYQSFLPALVRRDELVGSNSKLEVSRSVAQIAGPGAAGGLIQLATAPVALLVDALSFLLSGLFLIAIRGREEDPAAPAGRQRIRAEIGEGLGVVFGNPLLRAIAACTATLNLFGSIVQAVFILYLARELGIGAGLLGLIFAASNVAVLLGAVAAGAVTRRLGTGPTIIGAALLSGLGGVPIAFAAGPLAVVVPALIAAQTVMFVGGVIYNITQVSLRQAITPDHLQGRMNATMRFIVWGVMPIGMLIGGALGTAIGLRPTIAVGALGGLLGFIWPLCSPLRSLREHPAPAAGTDAPEPARAAS
jgi:MFS family permease